MPVFAWAGPAAKRPRIRSPTRAAPRRCQAFASIRSIVIAELALEILAAIEYAVDDHLGRRDVH